MGKVEVKTGWFLNENFSDDDRLYTYFGPIDPITKIDIAEKLNNIVSQVEIVEMSYIIYNGKVFVLDEDGSAQDISAFDFTGYKLKKANWR